jgi:transcriptional regulator with XRE-family HTH domain
VNKNMIDILQLEATDNSVLVDNLTSRLGRNMTPNRVQELRASLNITQRQAAEHLKYLDRLLKRVDKNVTKRELRMLQLSLKVADRCFDIVDTIECNAQEDKREPTLWEKYEMSNFRKYHTYAFTVHMRMRSVFVLRGYSRADVRTLSRLNESYSAISSPIGSQFAWLKN